MCFVYTDNDKPEMTMPKQIDVKVTKLQNKHGHGATRKISYLNMARSGVRWCKGSLNQIDVDYPCRL